MLIEPRILARAFVKLYDLSDLSQVLLKVFHKLGIDFIQVSPLSCEIQQFYKNVPSNCKNKVKLLGIVTWRQFAEQSYLSPSILADLSSNQTSKELVVFSIDINCKLSPDTVIELTKSYNKAIHLRCIALIIRTRNHLKMSLIDSDGEMIAILDKNCFIPFRTKIDFYNKEIVSKENISNLILLKWLEICMNKGHFCHKIKNFITIITSLGILKVIRFPKSLSQIHSVHEKVEHQYFSEVFKLYVGISSKKIEIPSYRGLFPPWSEKTFSELEAETALIKYDCAIITAYRSTLSKEENLRNNKKLESDLARRNLYFLHVKGCYREEGENRFSQEQSFFVYNCSFCNYYTFFTQIHYLSCKYDQDCFLYKCCGMNRSAFLIGTNDNFKSQYGDFSFAGNLLIEVPADTDTYTLLGNGKISFKIF